jgi:hypothetical protein
MEELFKISDLQSRHGLSSKQAVYDRIHKLKIIPVEKGYLSSGQLDLLDRLDKHLKSGGTFKDFAIAPEVEMPSLQKIDIPSEPELKGLEVSNEGYLKAFDWMGGIVEQLIAQQAQKSPLDRFEDLERAAELEIILPTSAIAQLLNTKPRGEKFIYGSYEILRCGKVGRESGWLVEKLASKYQRVHNSVDKSSV